MVLKAKGKEENSRMREEIGNGNKGKGGRDGEEGRRIKTEIKTRRNSKESKMDHLQVGRVKKF